MTVLNRSAVLLSVAFIFLSAFGACDIANKSEKAKTAKETHGAILATVNGVPIGYLDVDNHMKRNSNYKQAAPQIKKSVLEMVIQLELMSQKAVELGLDKQSEEDQMQIQRLEAQLNAYKRKILSKRFRIEEIVNKAVITEDEIKTYYAENLSRIQTEFHVRQIRYRSNEKSVNEDLNEIKSGASFEAIAERRFPKLPKKMERYPWDLGYLRWNQIPETWQDIIYGMKEGETSGIINEPENELSIIMLVEKRENPDADFERWKSEIATILRNKKTEALGNQWEKELRDTAEIIYYGETEKEDDRFPD